MTALQDITVGVVYRIVEIRGNCPTAQRLRELGMLPGALCRMVRRAPFGGPMEVALEHRTLGVRLERDLAVFVEPATEERHLPSATDALVHLKHGPRIDNVAA